MFYVKSNDGTKLAVYDPNPQGKWAIVLIHGWPLSHKMYEYQEELLLNCGFRVVTMDLRGYGNSDAPRCGYYYDQMARDIYNVIKALRLKSFILCGFSMGGAIALRYMNCYQGYGVYKLILIAAAAPSWTQREGYPYGIPREKADEFICQAAADRPQLCHNFAHEMLFASPHSEPLKNWFEDIALSASGIATIQSAYALRDEDGREDLKAVHVPTAIFAGAKDQVVLKELTDYQHREIANSKLYVLENSAHGVFYDELDRFNECFLEFINE